MSGSSYVQSYSGFVGVDFTSDPAIVARNRLSHCVNMWRDYDSENGAAIETFPGFRSVVGLDDSCGDILKVYHFKPEDKDYLIIHATKGIFAVKVEDITKFDEKGKPIENEIKSAARIDVGMTEEYSRSLGFVQNNRLWIISNQGYFCVSVSDNEFACNRVYMSNKYVQAEYVIKEIFIAEPLECEVEFVSNGEKFYKFWITQVGPDKYMIAYCRTETDYVWVWESGNGWAAEEYKRIAIEKEQIINDEFASWLEEYCTTESKKDERSYAYVPTTFYNGKAYEQRNMLMNQMRQIEHGGNFVETQDQNGNYYVHIPMLERVQALDIKVTADEKELSWWNTSSEVENGIELFKEDVYDATAKEWKKITIEYFSASPISFGTLEEGKYKSAASLEYGGTSMDAILGCTKAAVYDGRVFLTGNPALIRRETAPAQTILPISAFTTISTTVTVTLPTLICCQRPRC